MNNIHLPRNVLHFVSTVLPPLSLLPVLATFVFAVSRVNKIFYGSILCVLCVLIVCTQIHIYIFILDYFVRFTVIPLKMFQFRLTCIVSWLLISIFKILGI